MYKACSKCGKIHDINYDCGVRNYNRTEADRLRNTTAWRKKALEIKERSNFLCSVCRDKGIYKKCKLESHHITKLNDRPDLLLEDSNIICLCVEHHKLADAGKLSEDYLKSLVEKRDR